MEECNDFRGISQSTTLVGVTPGLGFRLMLLLLRFRCSGRPVAVCVDAAGGGGFEVDDTGESSASGSGMVGRVGSPL